VGLGAASVREIDRLNIYHATVLAMRRALGRLPVAPEHVLVDGKPLRSLGRDHTAVVGGDALCYSIACASIVAKVTRDRLMAALGIRYPHYGWTRNVGYGTDEHRRALGVAGLTPHHRRSFGPVGQLALDLAFPVTDAALTAGVLPMPAGDVASSLGGAALDCGDAVGHPHPDSP
jgi:ribonuclease HII